MNLHGTLSASVVPVQGAVVTAVTVALIGGSRNRFGSDTVRVEALGQKTMRPRIVNAAAVPTAERIATVTVRLGRNSGVAKSVPSTEWWGPWLCGIATSLVTAIPRHADTSAISRHRLRYPVGVCRLNHTPLEYLPIPYSGLPRTTRSLS